MHIRFPSSYSPPGPSQVRALRLPRQVKLRQALLAGRISQAVPGTRAAEQRLWDHVGVSSKKLGTKSIPTSSHLLRSVYYRCVQYFLRIWGTGIPQNQAFLYHFVGGRLRGEARIFNL